jgi:ubiquinol-cytochrome c reductase cytochrome c subunit
MSRSSRRTALALLLGTLALAAVARAQLPSGVSRPDNEQGLSQRQLGAQLYAGNCASCHGIAGRGISQPQPGPARGAGAVKGQGPPLVGVGAQAADLYLSTGFMPLDNPHQQPWRKRVLFTPKEIAALTQYVASLGPGPPIPHPNPSAGNVSDGFHLFTDHCAGCHQAVAEGGYVTDARVPPIKKDTPAQIAEAVRVGPYLMPKFSRRHISDRQLNSIIAYIEASRQPNDRGGWGIGHIGPVPEGLVTWFIAAVALVGLCVLIGERLRA